LGISVLVLVLGVTGQIAYDERDRIVAYEPSLKPWFQTICQSLKCTISPLRRIDSVAIDSSSFSKLRAGEYRLNLTLKNTATVALAVPAVELTLTDTQDQPVVRRVFSSAELGAKSDTLAAGAEWPASVAMAVKITSAADRIAGYRVLAFYP
jgi:hypothetical protein